MKTRVPLRFLSIPAIAGMMAVLAAPAWADPDDTDPDLQPGEFSCALQIFGPYNAWRINSLWATVTVPVYQSSAGAADPVARSLVVEDPGNSGIQSSQCVPADDPTPIKHDSSEQLFNCEMDFKDLVVTYNDTGSGPFSYWTYPSVTEIVYAHDGGEAQGEVADQTVPVPGVQFVNTNCHAIGPAVAAPAQPAPAKPAAPQYDQIPPEADGDD